MKLSGRERCSIERQCSAEHIAVGSEILLGQILNRHAQTVSRALVAEGFHLYHHTAVGDNQGRVLESLRIAAARSNVVIITGGLGPTEDDLTKECLAEFLNRPLVLDAGALATLMAFFERRERPMPAANRKQALCIADGELLPNPNGTAPGQYVNDPLSGVHFFLLPGPPLEMEPMLVEQVLPRLRSTFTGHGVVRSKVLHLCGIGESDVDAQIADVTSMTNPTVAPLAGEGEMVLRITAAADNEAAAWERIRPLEERLTTAFAPYLYGLDDDSLPSVVGRLLRVRQETLATAESCTGGLLSSMITAVPGSSASYLGGIVAYHNEAKQALLAVDRGVLESDGAVSEKVAVQMAEGAKRALTATYAISLTGIAGPDGGTPEKPVGLVFGAIAGNGWTQCFQMHYRGSREQIRIRASKQMLWRLWSRIH